MRGDRLRFASLVALLLGSLALYGALAALLGSVPPGWNSPVGFSLPTAAMFRAMSGLPALALSAPDWQRAMTVTLVLLWVCWAAALLVFRGLARPALRQRAAWIVVGGAAVMLALVVVCAPPMLSSDLFRQAAYGRMVAHHHLNPYATPVNAIPHDPAFALANHPHLTTHYGPAYTLLSALVAALAPSTALGLAVAWKAASACGALACAFMVAPLARALGGPDSDGGQSDGRQAQLWVAWNPLLVIESAVSAHPEPIMMFAALAGILLWQRGRPARGAIVLVVSTLTKWITGLILVFAIVRETAQARPATAGRRLRVLLALGAVAGLTAALLYLPFVRGLAARGGISDLALRGSATVGSRALNPMPQWASLAGFAVLVLASLRFVARGDWPRLIATAVALTLVFITLVNPWPFPWYFLTPLVLVAALPPGGAGFFLRALTAGIAALSLLLMYTRLIPWR